MTRCQEMGPKDVGVAGLFSEVTCKRRHSSGMVLP
ncbi:MAG: hypothetical protein JWR90_1399 [Marmoricola sp.]|nr:hypothetical protein [Marmoricola sp.]